MTSLSAQESPLVSNGSFTSDFVKKTGYNYQIALPADYEKDTAKTWPVLIFLHGAGERGDDVSRVSVHGPLKEIKNGRKLPMIVVAPQCPAENSWDADAVIALLDEIKAKYRVDAAACYLTGLSMGGFGTWDTLFAYPDTFAAAVPVCGSAGIGFIKTSRVKDIPVWAFHGAKDSVVPVEGTTRICDALKAIGADVTMTIYPEANHDSWTETYANDEVYAWLLRHRR